MKAQPKPNQPDFSSHFSNPNLGGIVAKDAFVASGYDFVESKKIFRQWVDNDPKLYKRLSDLFMETAIDNWCSQHARQYRGQKRYPEIGNFSNTVTVPPKGTGTADHTRVSKEKMAGTIASGAWGKQLFEQEYGLLDGTRFRLRDATRPQLLKFASVNDKSASTLLRDSRFVRSVAACLPNETVAASDVITPQQLEVIARDAGYLD